MGFGGNGTNFYAYAGNDPVDNVDPSGCGFIDCVKALAELERALAKLAERQAENAAAGKCDSGHDKSIEEAKYRAFEMQLLRLLSWHFGGRYEENIGRAQITRRRS